MALSLTEILQRAGQQRDEDERHSPGQQRLLEALGAVESPDFGSFRGELSTMAEAVTQELFGPGGPVEQATGQALRSTVQTGFGPQSGGFTSARQNILGQAQGEVTNRISQGAMQLAPLALQQAESLFGGAATVEQLGLAENQLELNRRQIEAALQQAECGIGDRLGSAATGALGGAAAGGFTGIGNLAGGIIGGLGGLFGGC